MCPSKCTLDSSINEIPDKWWYDSTIFVKTNLQENGLFWYNRTGSASTNQVKRILMSEDIPLEGNEKSESDTKKMVSVVYFDKVIENLHNIPFPFEVQEDETFGELKKRLFKSLSISPKELNEENVYLVNKECQLFQYDDDDVPDEYVAIGYDCPDRTLIHFLSDKGLKINS